MIDINGNEINTLLSTLKPDDANSIWETARIKRTHDMIEGLLKALTNMQDKNVDEINLDIETMQRYMPLDRIIELSMRNDLDESMLGTIKKYLLELPGYTEYDAIMGQVKEKTYEQHAYTCMRLSEVLRDHDTFGRLFRAPRDDSGL